MNYVVYAIALLLLVAVALFVKVVFFDKRPQKVGLLFILLAVPLYLVYYNDRWPTFWGELNMRSLATPLENYTPQADVNFVSDIAPAGIVGLILLIHLTVFQRVAVRRRLQRIHDPIATFFARLSSLNSSWPKTTPWPRQSFGSNLWSGLKAPVSRPCASEP